MSSHQTTNPHKHYHIYKYAVDDAIEHLSKALSLKHHILNFFFPVLEI